MIRFSVNLFLLLYLLFQSNSIFACCSSPLAEIVYIGTVSKIKSETVDGDIKQKITIKNIKNIVGIAPEKFVVYTNSEPLLGYNKVSAEEDTEYIIILYDAGKHDDKEWLLEENKWGTQKYSIHPYVGFFRENSCEAQLVLKLISYHENLNWTNDFKFINVFFIKK